MVYLDYFTKLMKELVGNFSFHLKIIKQQQKIVEEKFIRNQLQLLSHNEEEYHFELHSHFYVFLTLYSLECHIWHV